MSDACGANIIGGIAVAYVILLGKLSKSSVEVVIIKVVVVVVVFVVVVVIGCFVAIDDI